MAVRETQMTEFECFLVGRWRIVLRVNSPGREAKMQNHIPS